MFKLANKQHHVEETYTDCLAYLTVDAEKNGLRLIASTLKDAHKKIKKINEHQNAAHNRKKGNSR